MKTSNIMQEMVKEMAERYGLDLTGAGVRLRMNTLGYHRLVVEKSSQDAVSIVHYREQHGHLVADPKIVFHTGDGRWIPVEITSNLAGRRLDYAEKRRLVVLAEVELLDVEEDPAWALANLEAKLLDAFTGGVAVIGYQVKEREPYGEFTVVDTVLEVPEEYFRTWLDQASTKAK